MKVEFDDLSGWLKTAAVVSWFQLAFGVVAFLIGFFSAW